MTDAEDMALVARFLQELTKDGPTETKRRVREMIQKGSASFAAFLKEVGIEDPRAFAEYVQAGSSVATLLTALSTNESSERLEGLTGEVLERHDALISQTRTLTLLTGILAVLTAVLVYATVVR